MRGAHKYCTFSLLRKNVRKYQNTSSDHCNTFTNNIYNNIQKEVKSGKARCDSDFEI